MVGWFIIIPVNLVVESRPTPSSARNSTIQHGKETFTHPSTRSRTIRFSTSTRVVGLEVDRDSDSRGGVSYGATRAIAKVRGWFEESPPADLSELKPVATRTPTRPARPAPAGMVWIPGGTYRMGTSDPSRHFADAPGTRRRGRWLLDGRDRGHQRPIRRIRQGHRLCHHRRAEADIRIRSVPVCHPMQPEPKPELLVPGSLVFTQPEGPGPERSLLLVELGSGRLLEAARRAGQRHRGQDESSGRSRLLEGRRGLREVGRQAAADRGRMGVRGPRRARGREDTPGATSRR